MDTFNPLLMSPYEFNKVMRDSPIAYIPFGTDAGRASTSCCGQRFKKGLKTARIGVGAFHLRSVAAVRHDFKPRPGHTRRHLFRQFRVSAIPLSGNK